MMYDDLVKNLRYLAKVYSVCENESTNEYRLAIQAADAIEELMQAVDKGIKTGVELARMHGSDATSEELEKAFFQGCELGYKRAKEEQWIPVTERLPEENEVVLVADKANDIGIGSLQPLWHGVVWVVPFEDVDNEFCPISHWMPLPEPPKDGEE